MEHNQLIQSQNRATLRGAKTGWLEAGNANGPILFFLHGYPDTPEAWKPQFEHFKDRFHLVAPYSRGAHLSAGIDDVKRYSSPSVAMDHLKILQTIDPEGQRPVFVIGHDLGAVQAWYLAPLLGKQLQGLTIINGLSIPQMGRRLSSLKQNLRSWYIYAFQVPFFAEAILKRSPGKFLNYAYRKGGLAANSRPKIKESIKGVVDPIKQYRALLRDLPSLVRSDQPRLTAPVQLLWGEEDPFLAAPKESEVRPYARDYEIRLLPGGHWVHLDNAKLVNELIDDFIDRLGSPKGNASC